MTELMRKRLISCFSDGDQESILLKLVTAQMVLGFEAPLGAENRGALCTEGQV